MPVTFVDRLPLPNLKVYAATSVALLSISMYYAMCVTSDPAWRANATLAKPEPAGSATARLFTPLGFSEDQLANTTMSLSDQAAELVAFMMQEPLCMWTLINMSYCMLIVFIVALQRAVFGKLRVSEAQRLKDKFWNYVFYKFIFVFGVLNVQYMDEVLMWCSWFTALGCLQLLAQLCKDRFEYLSFSPNNGGWARARLLGLLALIIWSATALLALAARATAHPPHTFLFMTAECALVLMASWHVLARFMLQALRSDASSAQAYYTHLIFETSSLLVSLSIAVGGVAWSQASVSLASLALLLQARSLLHELRRRQQRHALYKHLQQHIQTSYPMATNEEMEVNSDNCAICWEPMKEARKLPCTHLFHNGCLSQWLQQDPSCPTCRRALPSGRRPPRAAPTAPPAPAAPRLPDRLFRFDGSRYVPWLPAFSVEVTRVLVSHTQLTSQIDVMARQVHQMFPHVSLAAVTADLLVTRSAELTVENILEGRLMPNAMPEFGEPSTTPRPEPAAPPPAAAAAPPPARSDAATAPPAPATADAASATDEPDDTDWADLAQVSTRFSKGSADREAMLQRRKELLIANARKRFLSRTRPASGAPASNAPAAGPSGAAHLARRS